MRSIYRTFPLFLTLVLAQCAEVQDFVSVTPSELLSLTVSRTSVPADGETTVTLTATLSNAAGSDQRTLIFQTDAGKLLDVNSDPTHDEVVVEADLSGYGGTFEEETVGYYWHAGLEVPIGPHGFAGLDYRRLYGTDQLFGTTSGDVDYGQLAFTVGFGF